MYLSIKLRLVMGKLLAGTRILPGSSSVGALLAIPADGNLIELWGAGGGTVGYYLR